MKLYKLKTLLVFAVILLLLTGCAPAQDAAGDVPAQKETLSVHFIDVGQADSILITAGDDAMLVDAGTNDAAETVVDYLKRVGVKRLDYVIGTHPHEDHIGGLDAVIDAFSVETVIMPRVQHNTKTFEDVLDSVAAKELKITAPTVGTTYELGGGYFTVLGPSRDHGDELNDWSVSIKLVFGETSFVMCGDAETGGEADIIATGIDLRADVLKLGHHGSSTSTSDEFLEMVSPKAVVICCGKDNSYGHPHRETMEKIAGLDVYRTDTMGTVVAKSDGETITWNCQAERTEKTESSEVSYILNTNTKKFHLPECNGAEDIKADNREDTEMSRDAVIAAGYEPCGRCKP